MRRRGNPVILTYFNGIHFVVLTNHKNVQSRLFLLIFWSLYICMMMTWVILLIELFHVIF